MRERATRTAEQTQSTTSAKGGRTGPARRIERAPGDRGDRRGGHAPSGRDRLQEQLLRNAGVDPMRAQSASSPARSTERQRLESRFREGSGGGFALPSSLDGLLRAKQESRPSAAQAVEQATSTHGIELPRELQQRFEASLGVGLSSVRIHTGGRSAAAADALGARAFTIGRQVHLNAGEFNPHTREGQRLLAHEVSHAVQQGQGAPRVQGRLDVSRPGDAHEREADRASDRMLHGLPFQVAARADGAAFASRVMCAPKDGESGDKAAADKAAEDQRKEEVKEQYVDLLGKLLGEPLGKLVAEQLSPDKIGGYIGQGIDQLTSMAKGNVTAGHGLDAKQVDEAKARIGSLGGLFKGDAEAFLKTPEGRKFLDWMSAFTSNPATVLTAIAAAIAAGVWAYKNNSAIPTLSHDFKFGDFTTSIGLDVGNVRSLDLKKVDLGLKYKTEDKEKGTSSSASVSGEYKEGEKGKGGAKDKPSTEKLTLDLEDKRKALGGALEQKLGTTLNLEDWKPRELELAYHVALSFENKDYNPPALSLLKGSDSWQKTSSVFADVLAKSKLDSSNFKPEELNLKVGLSYSLSRQATITTFNGDGTTTQKKVDPLNLSLSLSGGVDVMPQPHGGGAKVAPSAALTFKIDF